METRLVRERPALARRTKPAAQALWERLLATGAAAPAAMGAAVAAAARTSAAGLDAPTRTASGA
jgi:hypothetical protein